MTRSSSLGALALALAVLLCGCELLQVQMPGEPLSKRDRTLRHSTREFATVFSDTIQTAADSIGARATNRVMQAAAVHWKIGASGAMRKAVLRSDPALALVDAWTLCRQMTDFWAVGPGTNVFGDLQNIALTNSTGLEARIAGLAQAGLSAGELSQVAEFVTNQARSFPLKSLTFEREPVGARWPGFDGSLDTSGTAAEAVSDLAGRVGLLGTQLPEETRWRMELSARAANEAWAETRVAAERIEADLSRATAAVESVPRVLTNSLRELRDGFLPPIERMEQQWSNVVTTDLQRVVNVVETVPRVLTNALHDLRDGFLPPVARMEQQWSNTLTVLGQQREAFMRDVAKERASLVQAVIEQRVAVLKSVDEQRAALMQDVNHLARETLERSLEQGRGLVRDVLFYAVLLVLIVLGLPFFFGFLLGRVTSKVGRSSPKTPPLPN